jgi:hypothetical protein
LGSSHLGVGKNPQSLEITALYHINPFLTGKLNQHAALLRLDGTAATEQKQAKAG